MSLPPNVIRVKRKRVEDAPVTFLHIDQSTKRHRSDSSHWVYQRRGSNAQQQAKPSSLVGSQPQIQLSTVADEGNDGGAAKQEAGKWNLQQKQQDVDTLTQPAAAAAEPRRFRVSKAMLASAAAANATAAGSTYKRDHHRYGEPTLFVERTRRRKLAPRPRRSMLGLQQGGSGGPDGEATTKDQRRGDVAARDLERPGVANRSRDAAAAAAAKPATPDSEAAPKQQQHVIAANPLPSSLTNRTTGDMDKIAADMNDWVLREVGASLRSQEAERQRTAAKSTPSRFRPKAPAKRYHERHPGEVAPPGVMRDGEGDLNMTDVSDDEEEEDRDDEDWVIEEYIRVPANSVALDVSPSDVGLLVLDGEEESLLFFGPQNDEDEDWVEDEEDENAENHYTADYPEDEVDSEDEFNRNAYHFRNRNASDDEEYDQDDFNDEEDAFSVEGHEDNDDARMTRILEQMKRLKAAQR